MMNTPGITRTGDNESIVAAVAKKLNMDGYTANVLPHEKQSKVKEIQDKGEIVAMTGDGVNDRSVGIRYFRAFIKATLNLPPFQPG